MSVVLVVRERNRMLLNGRKGLKVLFMGERNRMLWKRRKGL
jgi:hypothetical protein